MRGKWLLRWGPCRRRECHEIILVILLAVAAALAAAGAASAVEPLPGVFVGKPYYSLTDSGGKHPIVLSPDARVTYRNVDASVGRGTVGLHVEPVIPATGGDDDKFVFAHAPDVGLGLGYGGVSLGGPGAVVVLPPANPAESGFPDVCMGSRGTGGVATLRGSFVSFEEPALGMRGVGNARAQWGGASGSFENPLLGFEDPLLGFEAGPTDFETRAPSTGIPTPERLIPLLP